MNGIETFPLHFKNKLSINRKCIRFRCCNANVQTKIIYSPNKNVINSESFKYKASITRSTYNVPRRITDEDGNVADNPNYDQNKRGTKEVDIAVTLKHLGNFLRTLDIPLINCDVSLTLSWPANCLITSLEKRVIAGININNSPTGSTFEIKDSKLYVPVATLSAENGNKLLEQFERGLKELLHGTNIDQKCLIRLKITI